MRVGLYITLLSFLVLSQGCGSHPRIRKLSESSVVVAFGDSLTAGTGATQTESYPSVLGEIIDCRVINAGVPGEESSAGRKRLHALLQRDRVDLVLLCEGGNDMLLDQQDENIKENIDAMVSEARRTGVDVILLGVPRPRLRMKPPPFYRQIADKHGIPCDTETIADILTSPALKSDHVHPNAAGYRKLAEVTAALIRDSQRE